MPIRPEDPAAYYVAEITAALSACKHYLDRVERLRTNDAHEQAQNRANLFHMKERLETWLNGKTDTEKEWRKCRQLLIDTSYLIGVAAIWLQEEAELARMQMK
jgi:hypothetical protein